jgi:Na+-driven multidrug efflux pump
MGFPTLIRTLLMTVSSVVTNQFAGGFSTSALAAISVVNRFMMFMGSALIGFGQGFQPVAGFNWGAKRYDRVWGAFKFCSNIGIFGMAILCTVIAIVAPQIMSAFSKDATVIAIGSFSIRLQCLSMPIQAWVIVVNMLFQSMGRATSAAILGLSRQGICFIPAVIIMSLAFGVYGLAAAQAVADGLSLALAFPLAFKVLKEIKRLMAENPVNENSGQVVETAQ